MDSFDILVIILSVFLAVFLLIGIVLGVLCIKLLKAIGRVTDKAEHVIETAEQVGEALSSASGSLAVFKLVRNVVSMVSKHNGKQKDR